MESKLSIATIKDSMLEGISDSLKEKLEIHLEFIDILYSLLGEEDIKIAELRMMCDNIQSNSKDILRENINDNLKGAIIEVNTIAARIKTKIYYLNINKQMEKNKEKSKEQGFSLSR